MWPRVGWPRWGVESKPYWPDAADKIKAMSSTICLRVIPYFHFSALSNRIRPYNHHKGTQRVVRVTAENIVAR